MQLLRNQNIHLAEGVVTQQDIVVESGIIKNISPNLDNLPAENTQLVPGFVDLQIYGAAGKLFSAEPTVANIITIEEELLKKGTTSFLICLATNTPQVFEQCISVIKAHRKQAKNCLGLHLEGPYLNVEKRGAHVANYIRKATLDEIKALLDFADGTVKMITLAPETQDDEVIDYLLANKIVVSLGHSNASFTEATNAYNKGIQTTTHLFNAMSPINHRQPGIPTAVFNHNTAMASIIADGLHVDFEIVKMAAKLMKERLFLITDAVTDCNSGPYQHQAVNGKYIMPDGTLSGSAMTMLQSVINCVKNCDISLHEAINMATYYPAKLINQHHTIGKINVNGAANYLVLNKDLSLKKVFFRGEEININKASAI